MKNKIIMILLALMPVMSFCQTLEECQAAAARNYPIVRKYDLIAKSTDYTLSNIAKGWLPQISASAQATYQSDVVTLPTAMSQLMSQMGTDVKGLRKDQYRVGIDITQTVYDGGTINRQKEVARRSGEVERLQNDVELYALRHRVNELYFGLLLVADRIEQNRALQTMFSTSEQKLASMFKNGAAAECDYNSVKAERLNAVQQMTELEAQRDALTEMLSLLCGIQVEQVSKPTADELIGDINQRPELSLFDSRLRLADAQERALDAALKPRLSVFASGFYGYPGYDMYHDMFNHDWTLNGMIGAKLSWNIGALYTRKTDKAKIANLRMMTENSRDLFLLNSRVESTQQARNIRKYRELMSSDEEIIILRTKVRQAAESKLDHGLVDVSELVREIYNEINAKNAQSMHEVECLKQIYDLKFTNNQ